MLPIDQLVNAWFTPPHIQVVAWLAEGGPVSEAADEAGGGAEDPPGLC